jgi:hypothetical protein
MQDKITNGKWRALCQAQNCDQGARTAGYCPRHYQQVRRHGRLTPEREYGHRHGCCRAENCSQVEVARGYCFRHYQQMRRYGRLTPERERIYGRTVCQVEDCQKQHSARGYCKKHYMQEFYLPRQVDKSVVTREVA